MLLLALKFIRGRRGDYRGWGERGRGRVVGGGGREGENKDREKGMAGRGLEDKGG